MHVNCAASLAIPNVWLSTLEETSRNVRFVRRFCEVLPLVWVRRKINHGSYSHSSVQETEAWHTWPKVRSQHLVWTCSSFQRGVSPHVELFQVLRGRWGEDPRALSFSPFNATLSSFFSLMFLSNFPSFIANAAALWSSLKPNVVTSGLLVSVLLHGSLETKSVGRVKTP